MPSPLFSKLQNRLAAWTVAVLTNDCFRSRTGRLGRCNFSFVILPLVLWERAEDASWDKQ